MPSLFPLASSTSGRRHHARVNFFVPLLVLTPATVPRSDHHLRSSLRPLLPLLGGGRHLQLVLGCTWLAGSRVPASTAAGRFPMLLSELHCLGPCRGPLLLTCSYFREPNLALLSPMSLHVAVSARCHLLPFIDRAGVPPAPLRPLRCSPAALASGFQERRSSKDFNTLTVFCGLLFLQWTALRILARTSSMTKLKFQ
jgi:hypothetical protein